MKIIIYLLLIYLVYKVVKSWTASPVSSERGNSGDSDAVDDIMIKDPVCGVYFPRKDGVYLNAGERDIYFCSSECRDKFVASGEKK